jgi:hypothetical protein
VTRAEVIPAREPITAVAGPVHQSRSGGVGHRFQVTFVAETVIEAADTQQATRQVEALGATDITESRPGAISKQADVCCRV